MADVVIGRTLRKYDRFKFRVEVPGIGVVHFQSAEGMMLEVGTVEYRGGGSLLAEKTPGLLNSADITLKLGATSDTGLWNWFEQVVRASAGLGGQGLNAGYTRTCQLHQLARDDTIDRTWRIVDAWPKSFKPGDNDNTSEEKLIEEVVLVNRYIELIQG